MASEAAGNIQAMIVGTSAVVAEPLSTILRATPGVEIAVQAKDGVDAVSQLRRRPIDVIFIDIGDPAVNPSTDLSRLLKVDPEGQLVLVATLTFANVKNAMAGLVKGAAEFVQAPARHTRHIDPAEFKRRITDLAVNLGSARRQKGVRQPIAPKPSHQYEVPQALRPLPTLHAAWRPKAIAVASSTGGPQALFALLGGMPKSLNLPIFITQHMPAGFTKALADHIESRAGWPCKEAEDGDLVQPGRAYVAPGGFHMTVENGSRGMAVRLNQGPEENFCRPSAEPMVRSLVDAYGADKLLYLVLTGMGADGKAGAQMIADGGGMVAVQDKESSVVWGMPGAVANAGACHAILPIDELGPYAANIVLHGPGAAAT